MIQLKSNFSYRYVNLKSVYLISNTNKSYFSVQHTSQQVNSRTNNVLLGFARQPDCLDTIKDMQNLHQEDHLIAVCLPFDDVKHIAGLLRMPLAVIVDKKVEDDATQYELHFMQKESLIK